jgi:nicotinate dehydrogenase subunit B
MENEMKRRDFFGLAGTGLVVLFNTGAQGQGPAGGRGAGGATDFNAFLKIGEDGRVTGFAGKVELGQGLQTQLATAIAEELDVTYDSVDMVTGDTDVCPWDMGTFGSMGTSMLTPQVRRAAAEARAVLLQMASERLGIPADRLRVRAGVVSGSPAGGRSVTYASLVGGKTIERKMPNTPLKDPKDFQVIGKTPRRKDSGGKITGKAKYAGDIILPGMLHAKMLRPPAKEAKLKSVDTSAAEKMAGVRVIRDGNMVAVLHERPDVADAGLAKVKAEFDQPAGTPDNASLAGYMLRAAGEPRKSGTGSTAAGEKLAAMVFDQTWLESYVAHAPIETHTATAQVVNGKVTIWASTQVPFRTRTYIAGRLQLPEEKVRVISTFVGGGFGGKADTGVYAFEAARLAMLAGTPVQVMYSRQEEFFYDTYKPAAVMKIRSGLTSAGKLAFWDAFIIGPGGESNFFYDVPNLQLASAGGWMAGRGDAGGPQIHPFAVGAWRGPPVHSNAFARESQIDVMAAKAGIDPVAFRLDNISNPRMRSVLQAAVRQFGWKPGKPPSGRGFGVACGIYSNGYAANMAEVAVDKATGKVEVKRVVTAIDVGIQINPDGLRQQSEGCVTMGLGFCLSEAIQFRGGQILSRNFDDYELPRFSAVPKIDVVLVDSPEKITIGAGELSITPMGPVIANAIYDAIGVRMAQLPMTPARIKAALARG